MAARYSSSRTHCFNYIICTQSPTYFIILILTSCRRAAATICPRSSPPSVGAEAPRAAETTAPADGNVAVGSDAQYVPAFTAAA